MQCKCTSIGLGAQSFEHANVLSKKTHFSASSPEVAIFGRDDLKNSAVKNLTLGMLPKFF